MPVTRWHFKIWRAGKLLAIGFTGPGREGRGMQLGRT